MSFVTFSPISTSVPVSGKGIYNGWKVNSIMHGGRKINLSTGNYYYVPYLKSFVSYRGSKAVPLTVTKDKITFNEKLLPRGHWAFKVDFFFLLSESQVYFN